MSNPETITLRQFVEELFKDQGHAQLWLEDARVEVDKVEWEAMLDLPFNLKEAVNFAKHIGAQISAELQGCQSGGRYEIAQCYRTEFAKKFSTLAA